MKLQTTTAWPISTEPVSVGAPIATFDDIATFDGGPGAKLDAIRARAARFAAEFRTTGTPESVTTCDLVTLPYPTKFGLFRAAVTPAPFLTITNRMLVIRWTDTDGRARTLLFEPSDVDLGQNTPYFANLAQHTPGFAHRALVKRHSTVESALTRLGIHPGEVDYLMFDHLHTQDIRRWIGTTSAQDDLQGRPVAPYFPNAKLIVQRDEIAAMSTLHPLQRPWYQPAKFRDLRPEAILPIDGAVLLGPGVAILPTPGHVYGNQTLVLNTDTGIWASSENAIATECLTPEHSSIVGFKHYTHTWGHEVVLNANTIETTADQYNSLILEKTIVDRSQADSRFLQFFPSSELTAHWISPGTRPTFSHTAITHGADSPRRSAS